MIHQTAIVDPGARIGANVEIGPYAIIGPHVEIGDNTVIGPHTVIKGHTTIGRDNRIFQFCSLGEVPQDKKPTQSDVFYFAGIDEARFKRPVMPGDQLHLHVEIERQMRGVWKFKAEARVDGQLAAEARLMCAKRDL